MAAATPSAIKNRIVTICGQISGITTAQDDWPEDNNPFAASELPAVIVQIPGGADNAKTSGNALSMTRTYTLTLLSARVAADFQWPDTSALEAIEPFLISIPQEFIQRPRLDYNDAGLAQSITLPQEQAIDTVPFNRGKYVATVFTMTVTTIHR